MAPIEFNSELNRIAIFLMWVCVYRNARLNHSTATVGGVVCVKRKPSASFSWFDDWISYSRYLILPNKLLFATQFLLNFFLVADSSQRCFRRKFRGYSFNIARKLIHTKSIMSTAFSDGRFRTYAQCLMQSGLRFFSNVPMLMLLLDRKRKLLIITVFLLGSEFLFRWFDVNCDR